MELRQLVYFVAVAKHQHVTQAALELCVAQSAVSRQIHQLEEELGVLLFARQGKGIVLTPFGKTFFAQSEQILERVQRALHLAAIHRNANEGVIRFGFPHSLGIQYVPHLLAMFRTEAPSIHFELTQLRVGDLLERLQGGDLDVALIAGSADDWLGEAGGEGVHLFDEPLHVVLPVQHSLARLAQISLQMLRDEPFILFKRGYVLRDFVEGACRKSGIEPLVVLEAEETDTIRGFVRAGLGISILPAVNTPMEGLVEVAIADNPIVRPIQMLWWRDDALSSASRRFISFAKQSTDGALHQF